MHSYLGLWNALRSVDAASPAIRIGITLDHTRTPILVSRDIISQSPIIAYYLRDICFQSPECL